MTLETAWSPATYTAQANDSNSVEHFKDALHTALSFNSGKNYGAVGDHCTTLATVTAISGSGASASLTATLVTSGAVIIAPAGACRSAAAYGGAQ